MLSEERIRTVKENVPRLLTLICINYLESLINHLDFRQTGNNVQGSGLEVSLVLVLGQITLTRTLRGLEWPFKNPFKILSSINEQSMRNYSVIEQTQIEIHL